MAGPLIGFSQEQAGSGGERILPLRLDASRHRYLHEHVLDGKPVLPAAVALELMAEAAKTLWPGWRVVEVREHKLLKGVELKPKGGRAFSIDFATPKSLDLIQLLGEHAQTHGQHAVFTVFDQRGACIAVDFFDGVLA